MNAATFSTIRPESQAGVPGPDPAWIDVHVLDMNHAWDNAGHDSIVGVVRRLAADFAPALSAAGAGVRLISYDVRNRMVMPATPSENDAAIFIGTGGPGHLDPRKNVRDDVDRGEIRETDAWEAPLFALFDAIERSQTSSLYAVCHSFGLLCRWSGIAKPVLRGPEKGGPSIGIVDNVLTSEAREHPWFSKLAAHLPDGRHVPIVDSRHYDLIPTRPSFPRNVTPIGFEAEGRGGPAGPALTMCEFARKPNGVPRMFAANHHPEIPDAVELCALLERKLQAGEVSKEWYDSRAKLVDLLQAPDHSEPARLLGAGYSFGFLVREALRDAVEHRQVRRGNAVSKAL